jgi:hypothetical protein
MAMKEQKKAGSKKPAEKEDVLYHTYPSGGSQKRK